VAERHAAAVRQEEAISPVSTGAHPGEPELARDDEGWFLRWNEAQLRRFHIEDLLLHEIGHHVDFYSRRWSKANVRTCEEFAERFAVEWSTAGVTIHDRDSEDGKAESRSATDCPRD
jgi:hypothetical protein